MMTLLLTIGVPKFAPGSMPPFATFPGRFFKEARRHGCGKKR